jgi:rSAM/selenodomain-associated transferase 1
MDGSGSASPLESLLLVQFARAPQVGGVKTRMSPHLSASQALHLHCELTLWTCRQLLDSGLGQVELSVAGAGRHTLFDQCLAMGVGRITQQSGLDLGQRMYNAFRRGLAEYSGVILVGSDCPGIDPDYLKQAAAALHTVPVVVGPANDGGYVLLGARVISENLFSGIAWGTDQVLAQTQRALARVGLQWIELPRLTDIDRPEDLPIWEAIRRKAKTNASYPSR